jgi:hypothetical protein
MMNLSENNIIGYATNYDQQYKDMHTENEIKLKLTKQDYLTLDDFKRIGRWKSKRPTKHYISNSEDLVREVSRIGFTTANEELKIGIFTLLKGCSYPVASVILHFKFPDLYPIIDFRALWSLRGIEPPSTYNYDLWQGYVDEIRAKSKKFKVTIRTLDKALWMYSEKYQGKDSALITGEL